MTILLLVAALAVRAAEPVEGVQRMAVRLMGKSLADHIEFRQIEADGDVFELRSDKSKIIISGNSANSMAMGLGHYLRYCCHVNVSWDADEKVAMLKSLPPVDKPLRRRALVEHRFFLNYCTFGYTMVWWQWREWERLIDWMALNGFNLPLVISGQESVW
ncbi:MAG: alpha-N-acetylglucosaminidase N-terminal domain-containing protein, partial [Bacteroidaceae bacterium]|nr:alpha-N-acetylglucosaminidase N-terminal domain-containing protein [Bacteroidaceae bacterium]